MKLSKILFALTALMAISAPAAIADPDIPIIIITDPDPNEVRGPSYNPFTAFLDDTDVVLYSADAIYGTVGVYLFSTAGDLVSTYFDTATGSITIPISGLSGSYTIIITTSDGLVFEGQFVIY